jgi:uncharacterized protein RhaS with RHS repeats
LGGVTQYAYDSVGNQLGMTDPLLRTTTSVYDDLNRLIRVTDPRGSVKQEGYDVGNSLTAGDLFSQCMFTYDQLDRQLTPK